MTKIAVPSMSKEGLDAEVCAHFGSCECFTIINIDGKNIVEVESIGNGSEDGQHNCAAPALILKANGVDAVLVSGIGGRPLMSLTGQGMKVYAGAVGKVADAVRDFQGNLLQELSTMGTCNCHHNHHGLE